MKRPLRCLLLIATANVATSFVSTLGSGGITKHSTTRLFVAAPRNEALEAVDKKLDEAAASSNRGAPKITKIRSEDELTAFLEQDERLCVIKFFASWCKSCQKFGVRYSKLAANEGDRLDKQGNHVVEEGRVRFCEIEFGSNAKLCRSLGIKRLPNVHFYQKGIGKIDGFSCGPSKFQKVMDAVNTYSAMTKDELKLQATLQEGTDLVTSPQVSTQLESSPSNATANTVS